MELNNYRIICTDNNELVFNIIFAAKDETQALNKAKSQSKRLYSNIFIGSKLTYKISEE